jgi:hypothetical protein
MKAAFSANGVITISPENETEAYALSAWSEKNFVFIEREGKDNFHCADASKLLISTAWPTKTLLPSSMFGPGIAHARVDGPFHQPQQEGE